MIVVTYRQISLLKFAGFLKVYREHCNQMTCQQAYEKTELELFEVFRIRQFSSYESFRNALYRHNQNLKKDRKKTVDQKTNRSS